MVTDRPTLRKIYEEGTGSIKVQGEWKVEEAGKQAGRSSITSIPYGVNKGKLESDIGAIIADRKLPQLLNLINETNEKEGLRIALEMKNDADPNLIMAYLYKHTDLQENFAYNLTCLVPVPGDKELTRPERLNLKSMLRYFLDFRFATVRRRFEFELEQLRKRIHILEGFQIIFDALDKAIEADPRDRAARPTPAEKLHEGVQARRGAGRRDPRRPAVQDRPAGNPENPGRAERKDRRGSQAAKPSWRRTRSFGPWSRTS